MSYGQYVKPNNSSRFIILTTSSIPHPQRITIWRTDTDGNTIQGPFNYDASAPDKRIQDFQFPANPEGYNVNFKVEMLIGTTWQEQLDVVFDYNSDGVSEQYKYYNRSIIFNLSWPSGDLNYLRLALLRIDIRRINDPDYQLKDEVYCEMRAEYPQNTTLPSKGKTHLLGSLGLGEKFFPGNGFILFEGAIHDSVKITVKVNDIDDLSGNDLIGSFEVSATRAQPISQYKKIGSVTSIRDTQFYDTYSTGEIALLGNGADYKFYLRADSSRQPVGFFSQAQNFVRTNTPKLFILLTASITAGLLTMLLTKKRKGTN